MTGPDDLEVVRASLGRALVSGDLFERFYRSFFASSPKIPPLFAGIDMERQRVLLRHGITLALLFHENDRYAIEGMERIRKSHGVDRLSIEPHFYDLWIDCFVRSVAELDAEFSPAIETAWRLVLQSTVDYFLLPH